MDFKCPKCDRFIYNRRLRNCGYCNATLPEDLLLSQSQIEKLDKIKEMADTPGQKPMDDEISRWKASLPSTRVLTAICDTLLYRERTASVPKPYSWWVVGLFFVALWLVVTLDLSVEAFVVLWIVCGMCVKSGQRRAGLVIGIAGLFTLIVVVPALVSWQAGLVHTLKDDSRRVSKADDRMSVTRRVTAVTFAPDGQTLASSAWDGTVRLWNVRTGRLRGTSIGHRTQVTAMVVAPDGWTLATSGEGAIHLWDLRDRALLWKREGQADGAEVLAFSPEGTTLAFVCDGLAVCLWDIPGARLRRILQGASIFGITQGTFSPDGQRFAGQRIDGIVELWDLRTGTMLWTRGGDVRAAVAFLPGSDGLGIALVGGTCQVWDVGTGEVRYTRAQCYQGTPKTFSPNGQLVATQLKTRRQMLRIDPKQFVPERETEVVQLWEVRTGALHQTLRGWGNKSDDGVLSLAFAPTSKVLATGHYDGTIRLWQVR